MLKALVAADFRVESCAECRLDLEDVFMNVTQGRCSKYNS